MFYDISGNLVGARIKENLYSIIKVYESPHSLDGWIEVYLIKEEKTKEIVGSLIMQVKREKTVIKVFGEREELNLLLKLIESQLFG